MKYLENVSKIYNVQDSHLPDRFEPYLEEVSKPIGKSQVYSGYKTELTFEEELKKDTDVLKQMISNLENRDQVYPHSG